jgi:uncharacterized membrane protein YqjE
MLGPARELARTLLSFAETRTRLAATELEEQSIRLVEILLWVGAALFFFGVTLLFVAVLIVLHFWDSNRLLAAGLIAALFAAGGVASALIVRARMLARPKFLAATLTELQRDKERLQSTATRESP